MVKTQCLYRVSLPWATFGFIVDPDGIVIGSAPIAYKYIMGKHVSQVLPWYRNKGADIQLCRDPGVKK
jgi:hypothetical protein